MAALRKDAASRWAWMLDKFKHSSPPRLTRLSALFRALETDDDAELALKAVAKYRSFYRPIGPEPTKLLMDAFVRIGRPHDAAHMLLNWKSMGMQPTRGAVRSVCIGLSSDPNAGLQALNKVSDAVKHGVLDTKLSTEPVVRALVKLGQWDQAFQLSQQAVKNDRTSGTKPFSVLATKAATSGDISGLAKVADFFDSNPDIPKPATVQRLLAELT